MFKKNCFRLSVSHDLNRLKDCRATLTFSGVKTDLSMPLSHKQVTLPVWQKVDDVFLSWFGKNFSRRSLADAIGSLKNVLVTGSFKSPRKLDSELFNDLTSLEILEVESVWVVKSSQCFCFATKISFFVVPSGNCQVRSYCRIFHFVFS